MANKSLNLSVIIPVFNEEKSVEKVIGDLIKGIKKSAVKNYEIIAVDDGSKDKSVKILADLKKRRKIQKLISHKKNMGYGRALKSGIVNSKYSWIMIMDADNTYPTSSIPDLIEKAEKNQMVVGARIAKNVKIPLKRIVPKKILLFIANFLTGEKIKDLNSGMRVFEKRLAFEFWHLLPEKFSFTSTITLASHLKKYDVAYVPISYYRRTGKSSMKPINFLYFITLVIRLVVYFNPLKFFFWPGMAFIFVSLIMIAITIATEHNLTDSGVLFFLVGIQTTFFGLIADLVAKTRESDENEIE